MDDVELFKTLYTGGAGAFGAVFVIIITRVAPAIIPKLFGGGLNHGREETNSDDLRRLSRIEARLDELGREVERLCKEVEKEKERSGQELRSISGILFSVNSSLQRLIGIVDGR